MYEAKIDEYFPGNFFTDRRSMILKKLDSFGWLALEFHACVTNSSIASLDTFRTIKYCYRACETTI